jgi:hypothetical protein
MLLSESKVLCVSTDQLDFDTFSNYKLLMHKFGTLSGYNIFTYNNNNPHNEEELRNWYDMLKKNIEENKEIEQKRVVILSLDGFSKYDEKKISNEIQNALTRFDIQLLLVNNRVNLCSMEEFFNKVEEDIGIIDKIRNKPNSIKTTDEDVIRFYRGKYKIKRISELDSSKNAKYEVLEPFKNYKEGDIVKLVSNQCWKWGSKR